MKSEYDFFGLKQGIFYASFDELNVSLKPPKPIGHCDVEPRRYESLFQRCCGKSANAQRLNEERKEDLALSEALKSGYLGRG